MTDMADGPQALEWTHLHAETENTLLSLSVTNSGERDAVWHDAVVRGVTHRVYATVRHMVGRIDTP